VIGELQINVVDKFITAQCYSSVVYSAIVCPCVCHKLALCQNGWMQDHANNAIR